ncbi:iron-sulfur cluster biosynthesis family protein [Limosilactobacillus sp.]|jgi:uncharacterized protein YqkB|uniref:iron-sulfur cluster biosynthesis family protein n=1 Tax=Limosilactobacillus sp. TaxID=2773925 RepID=UPI0035A0B199
MKLTFTDGAVRRLKCYLNPQIKLILDYDDGVGPFSKIGNCSLDANYRLIIVNADQPLTDFPHTISSNLGAVYYKEEAKAQYADQMTVRFNPHYFTMPLVTPQETLTENMEVVDLFQPTSHNQTQHQFTHDC